MDMQKDEIVSVISSVEMNDNKVNVPFIINNIDYSIIYSLDENGNYVETKIDNGYLDIGLNDTMKDMFVNFIGACVFSIFGFLYLNNRNKYKFINNFIPVKNKSN